MLLQEIIAGTNKELVKDTDAFWVLYSAPKIHFFPRYSSSWNNDMVTFYGGDDVSPAERRPIYDKISKVSYVDYGQENSHGWFSVSPGVVDFDISKISGSRSRRKATPMGQERNDKHGDYPILAGELTFKRLVDMQKVLKALVKMKPSVAKFKVLGDDRVRNMTVQQVIDGGGEAYDHRKAFTGSVQELVLFHGTSAKRAADILKVGMKPNTRGTVYSDMIDGYSQKNVYLTSNPAIAANYATREAINDKSNAAILEITLTPMMVMKLLPDEDSMNWLKYIDKKYQNALLQKYPVLSKIWPDGFDVHMKNLHHATKRFGLDWLLKPSEYSKLEFRVNAKKALNDLGYTLDNIESLEKELYVEIMNTFIKAQATKSLKSGGTTAYPGTIPAKQVKLMKTWSLKGSKMKPEAGAEEYSKATDAQAASAKYH